jgi:hypothetical protein
MPSESVQHGGTCRRQPPFAVGGDPGFVQVGDKSAMFIVGDPVAGGGLNDR